LNLTYVKDVRRLVMENKYRVEATVTMEAANEIAAMKRCGGLIESIVAGENPKFDGNMEVVRIIEGDKGEDK
jgi:hypothetical protein